MTAPEWRDCADPDELAAAVAAGVEVFRKRPDEVNWSLAGARLAESFAGNISRGIRYQLPASWSWRPEPPAPDEVVAPADDLRERRVWTCKIGGRVGRLPDGADAPMRRAVAGAFAAVTGCPVEFCFSGWGDDLDESELAVVEDRAPDPEVIRAALAKRLEALPNPEPPALAVLPTPPPVPPNPMAVREFAAKVADYVSTHQNADGMSKRGWAIEAVVQALEEPTASQEARSILAPTPPWPGAVPSGLVDEDGVPTWLAQAGDVRGEQVRGWRDMAWYRPDGHSSDTWVEVRAPRAMPEPETERVPWWDAVGRTVFDQDGEPVTIEHVECGDGAGPNVTAYNAAKRRDHGLFRVPCPVWGDGTVEVLKDGDQ